MKNIPVYIFVNLWLIIFSLFLNARSNLGTTTGAFLKIGPSARFSALGGAGIASIAGVHSLYYNPASALDKNKHSILFTHILLFQDVRYDYISYSQKTDICNFGLGVTYVNEGSVDRATYTRGMGPGGGAYGEIEGTAGAYDVLVTANVSKSFEFLKMIEKVQTGMNIKYLQMKLDDKTGMTVMIDLGVNGNIGEKFRYGLAVKNLGLGVKFYSQREPLPLKLGLGSKFTVVKRS